MTNNWPNFHVDRDSSTIAWLHLASQMPGKLLVAHVPWVNHGWHVALHPVGEGLITAPIASGDGRIFTITLDLCAHGLSLRGSDGTQDMVPFKDGMSIAELHCDFIGMLNRYGLPSDFNGIPSELPDAIPFTKDKEPRAYCRRSAETFRAILSRVVPIFERFRAGFSGKSSPVHFFWGSFDLAATRFSGRQAPLHPGGVPGLPDRVTREAYSQEVSSVGFWPGNAATAAPPIFYSYAYPEPAGFRSSAIAHGHFDENLGEFILGYDDVRRSTDPERMLMEFLQSSYEAAANFARWDRMMLEREPVAPC